MYLSNYLNIYEQEETAMANLVTLLCKLIFQHLRDLQQERGIRNIDMTNGYPKNLVDNIILFNSLSDPYLL